MVNYSTHVTQASGSVTVLVCINERFHPSKPSCAARGSRELMAALRVRLAEADLAVEVRELLCFGRCERGPNIRVAPGGAFFHEVDEAGLDDIINAARNLLEAQC